jgi:WhiB family redox-sensing transcriptional regulator
LSSNVSELPSRLRAPRVVSHSAGFPCQQEDPGLWFSSLLVEMNLAKTYCRECPNRDPCLAGALERGEAAGVWGGEIFEQGRIVENKRPRGRPRKHAPGGGR